MPGIIRDEWQSDDGSVKLILGDCLEVLPTLKAGSVDCVATDPPYHRVKNEAWDRQWKTDADYLAWLGTVLDEFRRVLKPNGSLYLFASPQMAWDVEGEVRKRFNLLNRIVWAKHDGTPNKGGLWSRACKEELRSFFPQTEYVFLAEQFGADSMALGESGYAAKCEQLRGFVFEPLRKYLADEWKNAGLTPKDANEATGTQMAGHWFTTVQWALPTERHYLTLRERANGHLRREYEDLRREYEDLRRKYEDLRRPFSITADDAYTDVWTFPTVGDYSGKHPCEKPADMIRQIVRASTRPGAIVLDCFCGSGVTGQVCQELGRQAILVDQDEHWHRQAKRRAQGMNPTPKPNAKLQRFPLFEPPRNRKRQQELMQHSELFT